MDLKQGAERVNKMRHFTCFELADKLQLVHYVQCRHRYGKIIVEGNEIFFWNNE